jgi:hypothetical protein
MMHSTPRPPPAQPKRIEGACPCCHERRFAWLNWFDDIAVECLTCRTLFVPVVGTIDRN